MQPRKDLGRSAGFSVTEITIVLTVLTILSGIAAPSVEDYVQRAQLVRAQHDVRTIGVALVRLAGDVGSERRRAGGWATYDLLVGAGDAADATAAPEWGATGERAGSLDDQLLTNGAEYTVYNPRAGFGWRGAYLQDRVKPDPWGNRYSVNVAAMNAPQFDTLVLSAGPDGRIESPFLADGLPQAGDDIASVMATSGVPE